MVNEYIVKMTHQLFNEKNNEDLYSIGQLEEKLNEFSRKGYELVATLPILLKDSEEDNTKSIEGIIDTAFVFRKSSGGQCYHLKEPIKEGNRLLCPDCNISLGVIFGLEE